jgi:hypothetical protein
MSAVDFGARDPAVATRDGIDPAAVRAKTAWPATCDAFDEPITGELDAVRAAHLGRQPVARVQTQ